jgi:hypothetical protein
MNFKFIKVFGERNCGTNFVNRLIEKNTDLIVLKHHPIPHIKKQISKLPKPLRIIAKEKLIDIQREKEFDDTYGWKHAAVNIKKISCSSKYEKTLFVFVSKNPFSFLFSLYNRPYNHVFKDWKNISDFLRTPWLCNLRDGLDFPLLASPIDLWNFKNLSYINFVNSSISNSVFFQYENIVLDPEGFGRELEKFIKLKHDKIDLPKKPVKPKCGTFDDYHKIIKDLNPLKNFLQDDITFIFERLEKSIVKKLYPHLIEDLK